MNRDLRMDGWQHRLGPPVLACLSFAFAHLPSACPVWAADELASYPSLAPIDGSRSPESKAPEVSTSGTEPYLGPSPDELAKLEAVESAASPLPAAEKEMPAETSTAGGAAPPTAEALAKLAGLQESPRPAQPWTMEKPAPVDPRAQGAPDDETNPRSGR